MGHAMTSKARVRATLAGEPVDRCPVTVLYNMLYHLDHFAEVARQLEAGRHARGFLTCTGSPITPFTPLERVQRFIALGNSCG